MAKRIILSHNKGIINTHVSQRPMQTLDNFVCEIYMQTLKLSRSQTSLPLRSPALGSNTFCRHLPHNTGIGPHSEAAAPKRKKEKTEGITQSGLKSRLSDNFQIPKIQMPQQREEIKYENNKYSPTMLSNSLHNFNHVDIIKPKENN